MHQKCIKSPVNISIKTHIFRIFFPGNLGPPGKKKLAERDVELRRQAVDADDDDDPPPASRPVKKEKKNGYAVDGFVVDTDDEEALAAEQPAKRRKETPPWDWTTASL